MLRIELQVIPPFARNEHELEYKIVGQAVHEAGVKVQEALKAAVTGTIFPGMTDAVNKPEMADAIRHDYGEFEFTVTAPEALATIEAGIPERDMKPAIYSGPRHRVSKKGTKYVIVPFKHNASELPSVVAEMASQLTISQIIGSYTETRSDDGAKVKRNLYSWGSNTGNTEAHTPIRVSKTGYRHKASIHSNMVKFPGGALVTFRTASENSDPRSWIIPAKDPNPVTESVWAVMEPLVEAHIAAAWERVFDPWQ